MATHTILLNITLWNAFVNVQLHIHWVTPLVFSRECYTNNNMGLPVHTHIHQVIQCMRKQCIFNLT